MTYAPTGTPLPVMEVNRPLAQSRLHRAIERALAPLGSVTDLDPEPTKIFKWVAVLGQEKRFLLFVFMMHATGSLTSQEIAEAIADAHSNVIRNLYALVEERLLLPQRDAVTKIVRFRVNRTAVQRLSGFFAASSD